MYHHIERDFQMPLVANNGGSYFFAKPKKEFLHFVFFSLFTSDHQSIAQYYIPRFEIVNWLYEGQESLSTLPEKVVGQDISLSLEFEEGEESKGALKDASLVIIHQNIPQFISLAQDPFGQQIMKDLEILTKIKQGKQAKSAKEKIELALDLVVAGERSDVLTPHRLTIAAFDYTVLRSFTRWQKESGFYQLLRLEVQDSLEIDANLLSKLFNSLPLVVERTSCTCGKVGCFFELLKTTYDHFFTESELLLEGELDYDKVKIQFTQLWNQLSAKDRAILNYLHQFFRNTPLINLYLLVPEADPNEYIYKMTFPYQPDSEDDIYVRKTAGMALWYLEN